MENHLQDTRVVTVMATTVTMIARLDELPATGWAILCVTGALLACTDRQDVLTVCGSQC